MRRLFLIQYRSIVCQSLLNSSFFFNSVRVNPFLRHLFSLFQPAARRAGGVAKAGRGARRGRRARWPRPRLWPLPRRARAHHQQRRGVQVSFYYDAQGESRYCALFGQKPAIHIKALRWRCGHEQLISNGGRLKLAFAEFLILHHESLSGWPTYELEYEWVINLELAFDVFLA